MKTRPARDRLGHKNGRGLLVNHLRTRYAFSPAMAEVLADDALFLRMITAPDRRQDGQIVWYAVNHTEPAGKALKDCEYAVVLLTLHHPDDIAYRHQHGVVQLRRRVLKRISDDALAQGAPLTQEDLAAILWMDRKTVASHIAALQQRGETVITRAHFTDAGRAVTHKRSILKLFLRGLSETEIVSRTHHHLSSIERYINGFLRVALLHRRGEAPQLISRITGFSLFLINEYSALYEELAVDKSLSTALSKYLDFYANGLLPRRAKKGA